MNERLTQVTVIRMDANKYGDLQPGQVSPIYTDLTKPDLWILACPICGGLGELRNHSVTEYEDDTVTISPSIVCNGAIYEPPLSVGPSAEPLRQYRPCTAHYFIERNQIRWCS